MPERRQMATDLSRAPGRARQPFEGLLLVERQPPRYRVWTEEALRVLNLARNDAGEPEIFRSVQGEGPNVGRVRTFIRLSGCNLHCVWCDTAYTWNWRGSTFLHVRDRAAHPHKFDPAEEMAKVSVAEASALVAAHGSGGVVITGGEPLLQRDAVARLIDALRAAMPGVLIEIETNGSIAPGATLAARVDLFMVSPKLAHSGNDSAIALNEAAIGAFAALEQACFKFVARTVEDIEAIATLTGRFGIAAQRTYVMPEGTDSATLIARGRALIDAALAHGFNYTDRLHIHLFGDRRGV
jgi:7-carboxy-7-deazaguanine synthase